MKKRNINTITNEEFSRMGEELLRKTDLWNVLQNGSIYAPGFLRFIGKIQLHTGSRKAASKVAEVALKYSRFHPNGSVNAATNIACQLESVAYHTESAEVTIRSAMAVELCEGPKKANELADNLGDIAITHIARDHPRSYTFDQIAKSRLKGYGIKITPNEIILF